MSTLFETVMDGLAQQGLSVEEDRGGLIVRGGAGDHSVSVWVDETERVVRAEEVLCYPVDDFSEELCVAMDQLNELRVGVTLSYQEQQRALVASTVWTSPSRSPSANQLHLLIGLLHEAKERDADALVRVADGEANWADVSGDLISDDSGAGRIMQPATSRFQSMEPPTRAIGNLGDWGEPPTREAGTDPVSYETDEAKRRPAGLVTNADEMRDMAPATRTPRKTSRLAFQMAVNAAAPRDLARQDMTVGQRSLGRRMFKGFLMFAFVGGLLYAVVWRVVKPMYPEYFQWASFEPPPPPQESPIELEYKKRKAMQPGKALLQLELEAPREFKTQLGKDDDFLRSSLDALGEKAGEALESIMATNPLEEARERTYNLWIQEGYGRREGARFRLAEALTKKQRPDDRIMEFLVNDLREKPAPDPLVFDALAWAPPPLWKMLVEQLGRDGEGAKARAETLDKLLSKDTEDALVLRSLIATGHAPRDAVSRLVEVRKVEWAEGEGRPILVALVKKDVMQAATLLHDKSLDRQVLGVDLLTEANTPDAGKLLIRMLKDRSAPLRARLAAAGGITKNGIAPATWTLVLIVVGTKEDETLKAAAQRALEKIPGAEAVAQLEPYLDPKQKYNVRHYAIRGLGAVKAPTAVKKLVELLQEEKDLKLRRLSGQVLLTYLKSESGRASLNTSLAAFFNVSRNDKDATVRKIAQRLYDSVRGG